jgi:hypothetical protein
MVTRFRQDLIAVAQVDIEIAVVVEIEKRRAAAHDGRQAQPVVGGRLVYEVKTGLVADVGEPQV